MTEHFSIDVVITGSVRIRPQYRRSTGAPQLWWLATSRRWTESLPINVYVIRHGGQVILFDAGQDRRSVTDDDYFPGGLAGVLYRRLARFDIRPDDTLVARLAQIGVQPSDVTTVVLSHLHQDHIGGIAEFPNATLVVARDEWNAAMAPRSEFAGFCVSTSISPGSPGSASFSALPTRNWRRSTMDLRCSATPR